MPSPRRRRCSRSRLCNSLEEIAAALDAFDSCPLKKTATRLCFADGNPPARVMLVGEAPDRDDDIQGKPFAGRPGQLLDRMLAAAGLSRQAQDRDSAVFITNVIFWRPPGNSTPTDAEIRMCLPFLIRTIELQKPDVIVSLGTMAAQRLTGSKDSTIQMRGQWMTANVSGRNIPLLPTLQPAFCCATPRASGWPGAIFSRCGKCWTRTENSAKLQPTLT